MASNSVTPSSSWSSCAVVVTFSSRPDSESSMLLRLPHRNHPIGVVLSSAGDTVCSTPPRSSLSYVDVASPADAWRLSAHRVLTSRHAPWRATSSAPRVSCATCCHRR